MHRFYCPHLTTSTTSLTISDHSEIHHLKKVLRLKTGDTIVAFNGQGIEGKGVIAAMSPHQITLRLEAVTEKSHTGTTIILACAIPKKAKFEFIIEKATELGVDEIIPLLTARTEVRVNQSTAAQKQHRYQTVAVNAAKQSGRTTVPVIHPPTEFNKLLKNIPQETGLFIPCLVGERKDIATALSGKSKFKKMTFFIGPEGDFTPQEVQSAIAAGAVPLSLGETVLKVDTAAIITVALAKLLLGTS